MMQKNIWAVICMMILGQSVFCQPDKVYPDPARLGWFEKAKFGIFMHWGVYSGSTSESWPFFTGQVAHDDYMANGKKFTAERFNPDQWADLFVKAGARYVVLTAMHCDGVTLFDSKYSNTSIRNFTPAKKDFIAAYTQAMRKDGLKTGLYYSHVDWSNPDYMGLTQGIDKDVLKEKWKVKYDYSATWNERNANKYYTNKKFTVAEQAAWNRFIAIHNGQVNELVTNYGNIDLLWFDFMYPNTGNFQWNEKNLKTQLLQKNPSLIINGRLGNEGDYYTAERGFPIVAPGGAWEYCETLSDRWGYLPTDTVYKSSRQLIRMLVECISMGGNFLLDIGPRPDGTLDPEHEKRLLEIGQWITKHQEAVYETKRGILPGHFYGPTAISPDDKSLFLYLFDDPKEEIQVKGLRNEIRKLTVVGHPEQSLKFNRSGGAPWANIPGTLSITVPKNLLDDKVTVIRIDFGEPINLYREKGKEIINN